MHEMIARLDQPMRNIDKAMTAPTTDIIVTTSVDMIA